MAMFRRMKDLIKDLPAIVSDGIGSGGNEQSGSTTSVNTHTSPLSPTPVNVNNNNQYRTTSTTTTSTSRNQHHQQQEDTYNNNNKNEVIPLPSVTSLNSSIWQIMQGSEVPTLVKPFQQSKLKSYWAEFLASKSDKDKVSRLNKLLPYFIGMYEDRKIDLKNMVDIFGSNSKSFAFAVSRRLVKDIQELTKANISQAKEKHAVDCYKLLASVGGNTSCGFELLYTLEILSDVSVNCEAMSEAGIPSTLARSLQLLFMVPFPILDMTKGLVEDKLIKTLCNLIKGGQRHAIEELQKTDTLSIIFSLMTNECQPTHRNLRAKLILFGLEFNDINPPTITYLNSKKIIIHLIQDLSNQTIGFTIETFVLLIQMIIKILSESTKKSAILMDDFHRNEGYQFLANSLFKLETYLEKSYLFDQLLDSITGLIYVGYGNIVLSNDQLTGPYQNTNINLKEISNQNNIAKNESIFILFEKYFLKSKNQDFRIKVLDKVLTIYSSNPLNFIILQHLNVLPRFIQEYETLSNTLKYHVMKIVCFVVTVLNFVPFQELSTFSLLINENPSTYTLEMIYQLITTLVNFEFRYKHIFREAGLLDVLIKVIDLNTIHLINSNKQNRKDQSNNVKSPTSLTASPQQQQQQNQITDEKQKENFPILLDSLYLLISEHPDNINIIKKFDIFETLLSILPYQITRLKSLRLLLQFIKYDTDTSQREFNGLVKLLTNNIKGSYPMKTDIFNAIRKLFNISKYSRDSFREHGGFISIISVLIGMESSYKPIINTIDQDETMFSSPTSTTTPTITSPSSEEEMKSKKLKPFSDDEKLNLIEAICRTTTSALCGSQMNRSTFKEQIGYSTFASGLVMTGALGTDRAPLVVDFIFDMVTENLNGSEQISNRMIINNIDAFNVILEIIPQMTNQKHVVEVVGKIVQMAEYARSNQESLSKLSIPDWILTRFPQALSNDNDQLLQPLLLSLIQTVGANCLSGSELRRFVHLLKPQHPPQVLLHLLCSMAQSPAVPPYFEFNLSKIPYGCVHLPIGSQDRTWPPTNGYTILFWLYIERAGPQIDLVHIYSEDRKSQLYIFLKNQTLTVHITNNSKYVIEFATFKFQEQRWYHIGIVQARRLLSGTDFKVYVDGFLKYTAAKAQYPAQVSSGNSLLGGNGGLNCDLGAGNALRFPIDQIWRIGPFYLMEEAMSSKHINTIYFLGPNYCANFKGRFSPYQTYEIINNQNLTAIKDLDYGDQLGPLNLSKVSMQIDENRIIVGLCANNKREIPIGRDKDIYFSSLPPHIESIILNLKDQKDSGKSSSSSSGGSDVEKIEIINQADLTGRKRGKLIASVEAFRRNKVADSIRKIGGMPLPLVLLEKAQSESSLYDSMGLLVGLLQNHPTNTHEMSLINGYELCAWILRSKSPYFSKRIIDLIFDLIGVNGDRNTNVGGQKDRTQGTVANWNACKYILMSYDLWKSTSIELQRYILQGFNDLLSVTNQQRQFNADNLRKVHIVQELIDLLATDDVQEEIITDIIGVLYNVLNERLAEDDIRLISAFLIVGLNNNSNIGNNRNRTLKKSESYQRSIRTVNKVFQMFLNVITSTKDTTVIYKRVSSFWCFFYIDSKWSPLTVSIALKTVCAFFLMRYDYCSGFIKKYGFKLLEGIIPELCGYQELYVTLLHLLLGSTPQSLIVPLCNEEQLHQQQQQQDVTSLEFHELLNICKMVEKNLYCIEAAHLLLAMVKQSYQEHYQKLSTFKDFNLDNQQQSSSSTNDDSQQQPQNKSLFSPITHSSNLSSVNGGSNNSSPNDTSPLSLSQTIAKDNSSNNTSTTSTPTTTSTTSTSSSKDVLTRMGNFFQKVEEKTLEFADRMVEDVDGVTNKKKRASISLPSPININQPNNSNNNNTNTNNNQSNQLNNPLIGLYSIPSNEVGIIPQQLTPITNSEVASNLQHTILTYLMYLFHENQPFQQECYSNTMIEYLSAIVFPNGHVNLPNVTMNTLYSSEHTLYHRKDRVIDLVLKFQCQIVLSALRKSSKAISITENVLDSVPVNTTDQDYLTYHTHLLFEILYTLETNITKSEYFENERIHSTLVKFCVMLVDRVYVPEIYRGIARRVLLFLIKLLEKLEADRPGIRNAIQPIYRSLNRTILFMVGQWQQEPQELLFMINHILNHQRIVFSDNNNNDNDFVVSLMYPLFKLAIGNGNFGTNSNLDSMVTVGPEIIDASCKLWRLLLSQKPPLSDIIAAQLVYKASGSNSSGSGAMVTSPTKQVIEPTGASTVDLRGGFENLTRGVGGEKEFKLWVHENLLSVNLVFEDNIKRVYYATMSTEKRNSSESLQSIKYKRRERHTRQEKLTVKVQQSETEKQTHTLKKVQYFVRTEQDRRKKIRQLTNDKQKFNAKQFETMKDQMCRERAVWGPSIPSNLDKWKLDSTEGPYRMRKKMEKNYDFYKNYPYVPPEVDRDSGNNLLPLPSSGDSLQFLRITGTAEANQLENSYWKSYNQNQLNNTNLLNQQINNDQNNAISSTSNTNNTITSTTTTKPRSQSLINRKSSNISPTISANNSTPTTPSESPLNSSTEGDDSSSDITNTNLEPLTIDDSSVIADDEMTSTSTTSTIHQQSIKEGEEEDEVEESVNDEEEEENDQAFTRLLDPYDQGFLKEEIRRNPRLQGIMYNCGSVDGMDKVDGIFIFCPVNVYIFDGYNKNEKTGEITEVEEKINTDWLAEGTVVQKKMISHSCLKWGYEDVREVLKRRYLLGPVAMELFSTDGRNTLIVLKDETTRDEVYQKLTSNTSIGSGGGDATGISGSQSGVDDQHDHVGVKEKFTSMWRKSPLTLKWQQGQVSNFQYLMHLNTLAGRSYNDLTQYPVFPWVLSDYESQEIDLDDPKVYRDLSKPMGALHEPRAQKFRDRFENWDDQEPNEHGNRVPKFHYGTHYSSAAIVLYYLIRLEPFTQHFLKLQSGRWDQADRLFSSLAETWQSSSCGSTGSIMELIPEFYYLPEFLENTNKFNFGEKQGGQMINDVGLPPWAKGSAMEFIRLHRRALESDYVSEHLHEWIDLIFGYKQQGKAAEEALNVFYYLTYEGAVNIDQITDPVEKAATIAQINNFGQTPKQLFDKPHPKRQINLNAFPFYAKTLVGNFIKDIQEPVGQIRLINDRATVVPFSKHLLAPTFTRSIQWGLPDGSIRYNQASSDKIKALEDHHDGPINVLTSTEDGQICVSGGQDSLVCVYSLKRSFTLVKRLCGHTGAISALAVSRPYSIIVSGSDDNTAIIWDLNRLIYVRTLIINDGQDDQSQQQLQQSQPQQQQQNQNISCIAIHDTTGEIVICSGTSISIYTVNGQRLLTLKTSQIIYDQITSCQWSKGAEWLGENVLLTGHRDGRIKVWALESRLLPSIDSVPLSPLVYKNVLLLRSTFYNPQAHQSAITAIHLTNDQQKLYTGDIDGRVSLWSDADQLQVKQRGGWTLTTNPVTDISKQTSKFLNF